MGSRGRTPAETLNQIKFSLRRFFLKIVFLYLWSFRCPFLLVKRPGFGRFLQKNLIWLRSWEQKRVLLFTVPTLPSVPCSSFGNNDPSFKLSSSGKDDNRQIRVNGKKCKWRSSRFCGIIKSDVKWQNGLVYTRWRCHLYDDGVETALKIQNAGSTSSIFKNDLRIARNRKTCPKTFIQASGTINVVGKLYANIIRRMLLGHSHNSQN